MVVLPAAPLLAGSAVRLAFAESRVASGARHPTLSAIAARVSVPLRVERVAPVEPSAALVGSRRAMLAKAFAAAVEPVAGPRLARGNAALKVSLEAELPSVAAADQPNSAKALRPQAMATGRRVDSCPSR